MNSTKSAVSSPYAVDFMAYDEINGSIRVDYAKTEQMLAQDAALTSTPNVGVPSALVTLIDPSVTEILFSAMNAKKLVPEVKKGSWVDKYTQFHHHRIHRFSNTILRPRRERVL